MILRKPYAFFIKHFKLIHIVLAVLLCYSIYNTKVLLDFFNEYAASIINVVGQDLTSTLLPTLFQVVPIFIVLFTIIILVVMIVKKKPNVFYVINIVIYIYLLVMIQVSKSTLNTMSLTLIDARTVRLVRDLITVAFVAQIFSAVIIIVRATGFDVKKFNFKEDLKDLEISEEDREEFEVQINFDKNKLVRNIRKTIRYLKYAYKENRLLANSVISGASVIIIGLICFGIFTRTPIIEQNNLFIGNNFTMAITGSYLTNTDYDGKQLNEDYYYLVLRVKIKNNSFTPSGLDIATTKILIGNYVYTPTDLNRDSFSDFGVVYQGENIGTEYENKVFIYQIPKQLINQQMTFSFVDKNNVSKDSKFKSTKVKIKYLDLTGIKSSEKVNLTSELQFKNSILSDYIIKINNFSVQKQYKLNYNFCISTECYTSYEYVKPSVTTNYNKAILRINGTLNKELSIPGIYDLYDFIEKFGKLYYTIDGTKKVQTVKLKEVVPNRVKDSNTYYIEILDEVIRAEHLSIVFTIRDRNYEYILK